jgi:hypothetical protein
MKKLLVGAALVGICLTTMGAGILSTPWNIPITASSWTAVTASHSAVAFLVKTRAGNAFKISDTSDGAKYISVATDESVSFDLNCPKNTLIFYLQGKSDTAEILPMR